MLKIERLVQLMLKFFARNVQVVDITTLTSRVLYICLCSWTAVYNSVLVAWG